MTGKASGGPLAPLSPACSSGCLSNRSGGTIGLENVVIVYLLVVVVAAAIGGRAAGIVAAVSAALAYDFFLTTPYHTLVIDSLAQVITVAMLVATGVVVSIGARVRRRFAAAAEAHADAIQLLHRVTETAAAGGHVDRVAAEGLQRLLGARRVSILRRSPAGFTVAVDIGETRSPLDLEALTHLDHEGRIPPGTTVSWTARWSCRWRGWPSTWSPAVTHDPAG